MPDELTTTEAAAYLAAQGYMVKRGRVGGSGAPSADTLKHWALAGKLAGARKRDNRWFIPRNTIDELIRVAHDEEEQRSQANNPNPS